MTENITIPPVDDTCQTMGYQSAHVCVPVTIKPFASTGPTETKCCGSPIVRPGACGIMGTRNGTCTFTICQCVCVSVPVNYGARAYVGDTYVACGATSANDICTCCDSVTEEDS